MTQACMGGWCTLRSNCSNYHSEDRTDPAERLCIPRYEGVDGRKYFQPSVDNPLVASRIVDFGRDHLNWLFPTASPAETPINALSPAGEPPLPGIPEGTDHKESQ